jgi:hypothetical protein
MRGSSVDEEARQLNVSFIVSCVRAPISLLLLVIGFAILITKHIEAPGSDEERQSLLGKQNHGTADYGAIPPALPTGDGGGDEDNQATFTDCNTEIREQRAKRLEEEGGWIGNLKSFAIFLPHLFPKDDPRVTGALLVRLLYMLQARVLNLLTPRQLGIITDKLSGPDPTMPWKDIGLWVLYSFINSRAGLVVLDGIASSVIANLAYQRITLLAYEHVLGLSVDFHTSKDSGEVLKALDQASSLNSLIEMVLFDICPIL